MGVGTGVLGAVGLKATVFRAAHSPPSVPRPGRVFSTLLRYGGDDGRRRTVFPGSSRDRRSEPLRFACGPFRVERAGTCNGPILRRPVTGRRILPRSHQVPRSGRGTPLSSGVGVSGWECLRPSGNRGRPSVGHRQSLCRFDPKCGKKRSVSSGVGIHRGRRHPHCVEESSTTVVSGTDNTTVPTSTPAMVWTYRSLSCPTGLGRPVSVLCATVALPLFSLAFRSRVT